MADLQLIQGEKFARTGGLKAGQLDNLGEQIGKGLEIAGKDIQEAMVKVSSWGDAEEAFNNDMQKVETDGFLSGNDEGFSEQDAASEYMTGLKQKYGDAAAKASRIENKGSDAYKNQVKIMNDVNAAAKNFAAQKDSLIVSRKEYQASPGSLSVSNSFDTSSASQMSLLSGKGQWNVDEKGNIIVDGQKMSDMGALRQKSELNSLVERVYSDTYESSLSSGGELTDTQVEKAGENVVTSLINSGDPKANVASFAFDPLTGTQTLYSKDSEEGKKLAEDLKNWESLTNEQKNQIYNQLGEKHKSLLRAQNQKGIDDYKLANPDKFSDAVEETYYDSDRYLDALNKKGGLNVVEIGTKLFMISEINDPNSTTTPKGKIKVVSAANTSAVGEGYTPNSNRQVPLLTADGKLNYEGFSILAQGKQLTRTVPAKKDDKTTTTDTKDDKTTPAVTEATLGGDTIPLVTETKTETEEGGAEKGTETVTGKNDNKKNEVGENNLNSDTDLDYFPEGYGEKEVEEVTSNKGTNPPNISLNRQELLNELGELQREKDRTEQEKAVIAEAQKAEDELSAIELEEDLEEEAIINAANEKDDMEFYQEQEAAGEKFSIPLTEFRAGVRKGEITMEDVDTKIKILNAQYKKGRISKAKYDKDIKFINEEIMPLLPDDMPGGKEIDDAMIANQLEQNKKDLNARKLNPDNFPPEKEKSIVEVNQEQEDELKIKEEVVNTASGTDTKKGKDQGKKFVDLKGSLQFPLVGGKGKSKVTRGFGTVKHETIGGIKVQSNGLRFDVKKGSQAAAVSGGEVVAIQVNGTGSASVMIKHGEYTTVYSPVYKLNVQKGQIIAKGQNLGKIQTFKDPGKGEKTELKFQIWKDNKAVNPEEWLA